MFEKFFVQPLFNVLIFVYNVIPTHDLGGAVVLLVALVRLMLWPLFENATKSQLLVSKIQPDIQRIQREFKSDQVRQTQELLALYKQYGFNPFASFAALLVQLPVLFALYRVFFTGIGQARFDWLYAWVANPGHLNTMFLGLVDLAKPSTPFVGIAGILLAVQVFMMARKQKTSQKSSQQAVSRAMLWMSPILTIVILIPLPSVITLYMAATTIVSIGQQYFIEQRMR